MIRVTIDINGHVIETTTAVRRDGAPMQSCTYETDDHYMLGHNYADGAVRLAIKMLERHNNKPSVRRRIKSHNDRIEAQRRQVEIEDALQKEREAKALRESKPGREAAKRINEMIRSQTASSAS